MIGPNFASGKPNPYTGDKGLPMYIYGLKCIFCQHALENLGIENGVLNTKCSNCGHISKPKPRDIAQNVIYNKFHNKSVQVEYTTKKPRSGQYRKASIPNSAQIHPDRKSFSR